MKTERNVHWFEETKICFENLYVCKNSICDWPLVLTSPRSLVKSFVSIDVGLTVVTGVLAKDLNIETK